MPSYRPSRTFIGFLVSYVAMIAFTALVGLLTYAGTFHFMQDEITHYNLLLLRQIKETVDKRLFELEDLSYQLSRNPQLSRLTFSTGTLSKENRIDIIDLMRSLQVYSAFNKFVDRFYLYFGSLDIIIDPNAKFDPRFFYDEIAHGTETEFDLWYRDVLHGRAQETVLPAARFLLDGAERNLVSFIRTVPVGNNVSETKIVYLVDSRQFVGFIRDADLPEQTGFAVTDAAGRTIVSAGRAFVPKATSPAAQGISYRSSAGADYVVLSAKSGVVDWTYSIVIPVEVFFEKAKAMRQSFLLIEAAALAVGLLIAGAFAYRSYSPIRAIASSIMKREGRKEGPAVSEMEFIRDSVLASLETANHLRTEVKRYRELLFSDSVLRLMRGDLPARDALRGEGAWQAVRPYAAFAVLIVRKASAADSQAVPPPVPAGLSDASFPVELDARKHAVLLCFSSQESVSQRVETACARMRETGAEGESVTVVTGAVVLGPDQIAASFAVAERRLEEIPSGAGAPGGTDGEPGSRTQMYHYPMATELQIMNKARAGNFEDVSILLDELFDLNFGTPGLSLTMSQYLFVTMANTVRNVMDELKMGHSRAPLERIAQCRTAEAMMDGIRKLYSEVCSWVQERKNLRYERLKAKILSFIEENHADRNLSLTLLSDQFSLSPSSISRIVKERSHTGFVDYLNLCRIEKAKRLLRDNNLVMAEIAARTGFQSANSLIRAFRKYTGVTPGSYRDAIRGTSEA